MRAPSATDIAAGEVILSVDNVSLSFGGVKAIRDVSFDIRKGEVRAIIGPNGAGKTSMLNVINGFYHPQKGRILFQGKTRAKMRPHEAAAGGIALVNTIGTGGGGFAGPYVLGVLREATGGYSAGMAVLAIGPALTATIVLALSRRMAIRPA